MVVVVIDGGAPVTSLATGFYFSDQRNLEFGLVQRRGGPCGVLAAMQAFIVDDLLQRGLFKRYDSR